MAHLVFSLQNYTVNKNAFIINETNGKIAECILAAQQIYFLFLNSLINCVSPTPHVGKPYKHEETEWHTDPIL